jgi:hypothetical protein
MNAEVGNCFSAVVPDLFLDFRAYTFDDFFYAGRMNAAVSNELFESKPRDLTPQRIEG